MAKFIKGDPEQSIILYVAGHLTLGKVEQVTNKIIEILS
jgi:hypothetical protein